MMKAIAVLLLLAPAATALSLKTAEEDFHCRVGYSCVSGETPAATRCACKVLGHLHEMNTPDLDKLAMLRALKDKDEGMLVRMRYRQTSRNLLMNMLGSKREETEHIAEVFSGSCEQAGYISTNLETALPYHTPLKVSIQGEGDVLNYRQAKMEDRSPIVHQAVSYGNQIRKDIFLREEMEKCIREGEDVELNLTYEPGETMDDADEVMKGLAEMSKAAQEEAEKEANKKPIEQHKA